MKENANTPSVYPPNNNRVYIYLDTYGLASVERGGKYTNQYVMFKMCSCAVTSQTQRSPLSFVLLPVLSLGGGGALAGARHGDGGDGEGGRREQAGERRHDPRAGVGLHGRLVLACGEGRVRGWGADMHPNTRICTLGHTRESTDILMYTIYIYIHRHIFIHLYIHLYLYVCVCDQTQEPLSSHLKNITFG